MKTAILGAGRSPTQTAVKKTFTLLVTLLCSILTHAQSYQWTWITGNRLVGVSPTWGTSGVAAPGNTPGARDGAAYCTDNNGNFWLCGGGAQWFNLGVNGRLNDLWKFNPSTHLWTWVSGDQTLNPPGNSGPTNTPSTSYRPEGRVFGAMWCDKQGNLWVFGGFNAQFTGPLSDLWKFKPTTGEWTLIAPSSATAPPATDRASYWTDNNGLFWLYGGDVGGGAINDLWKFDPTTLQWTWVRGTHTVYTSPAQSGTWGTQGVSDPANTPGSREDATAWVDKDNNFWLFGGIADLSPYNDLWKYSPLTNQWTWMNGSNNPLGTSVYGTKGVATSANNPGARRVSASFHTIDGKLWLFGGQGSSPASNPLGNGMLDDLWSYDIATGQWTWVDGEQTQAVNGIYTTQGVSTPGDEPGGRFYCASWTDASNHLWLFGGAGYASVAGAYGVNNDLWEYLPQTKITLAPISPLAFCPGSQNTVSYTATGVFPAGNQFVAQLSDATGDFNNPLSIGNVTSTSSGTIAITIPADIPPGTAYRMRVISPSTGTFSADNGADIVIYGKPTVAITASSMTSDVCPGSAAHLTAGATGGDPPYQYQWSTGSTGATLDFVPTTDTTLQVTVADGCSATAAQAAIHLTVYTPHPVKLSGKPVLCPDSVEVLNAHAGYTAYTWQDGSTDSTFLVRSAGTYAVSVTDQCGNNFNASIAIGFDVPPTAFLPADTAICTWAQLAIRPKSPYTDYRWSTGEETPGITVSTPGAYILAITDKAGCPAADTIIIENKSCFIGFRMPTAFTPNGDGHNDVLKPTVLGPLTRFHLTIFNRYGGLVFESADPNFGWTGFNASGGKIMAGMYVWSCEYQFAGEPTQLEKGTVFLIR